MDPATLLDKIWRSHVVAEGEGGLALLYIDRHFAHDGSFHAFEMLRNAGRKVRRPDLTFAVVDHYIPTVNRDQYIADEEVRSKLELLEGNAAANGVVCYGRNSPRQGIAHVVGPEQGIVLPGLTLVCGDSHTSTQGAVGALAFGIGASEVGHVLATQTIWQHKPRSMRINATGRLPAGVYAKDFILALIAKIGVAAGVGCVIEYAGAAMRALSVEARLTVCNMSIEAGARAGMIAPDDTTFQYLSGRPYAPTGRDWDAALAHWRTLPSDPGAKFDREVEIDASALAPMATWGVSPQDAAPIDGRVPDPADVADPMRRASVEKSLAYMGLTPGTRIDSIPINRVFIGSCTNSRIEDLREAGKIAAGRKAVIPAIVVPGSEPIRMAAEAEGLDRVFRAAGFEWRGPGCSTCIGMNGDLVPAGERCASTSNRNFENRQGRGSKTHLVSPAMAAAAAVTGVLTDIRRMGA